MSASRYMPVCSRPAAWQRSCARSRSVSRFPRPAMKVGGGLSVACFTHRGGDARRLSGSGEGLRRAVGGSLGLDRCPSCVAAPSSQGPTWLGGRFSGGGAGCWGLLGWGAFGGGPRLVRVLVERVLPVPASARLGVVAGPSKDLADSQFQRGWSCFDPIHKRKRRAFFRSRTAALRISTIVVSQLSHATHVSRCFTIRWDTCGSHSLKPEYVVAVLADRF